MANKLEEMANGNALLVAILNVIIGLILLVCGRGSIDLVFWLTGVIYIILGIVQIVLKTTDIKGGLITIIVGIIFVIIVILDLAEPCVGIILILSALPTLLGSSNAISEKFGMKPIDVGNALFNKIFTIVLLVMGICLVAGVIGFDDHGFTDILIRVGGLVLLAVGVLGLIKSAKN